MLQRIPFKPGVVRDDSPLAAEGTWIDADKCRFRAGQAETIGGWEKATQQTIAGKCRGIHAWAGLDGAPRVGLGTHSNLYVFFGGALYDVTPVGLAAGLESGTGGRGYGTGGFGVGTYGTPSATDYFPRTWSVGNWGEDMVASPRGGGLYRWSGNTAAKAVLVPGAPTQIGSVFVTAERITVACGSVPFGGGTYDPMTIRWSHQEDIEDWVPTATNQSGEYPLALGGRIVRGLPARGTNLIWTDLGCWTMSYTGDPLLVYSFANIGSGCGLIGPNAAVVHEGTAYWMSPSGEFYMYSGGVPQQINCPIQRYIKDNLSWVQSDKIYAASNSAHGEIWFFYPDRRDGNECSRYAAYNYLEDHWTIGTWDRTAWCDAGVWQFPLATDVNGGLYFHERLFSADGGPIVAYVESAPIDLADGDTLLAVTRIAPDFDDLKGGVAISLKGRLWPAGVETTYGPFMTTPSTLKHDLRMTARQVAVRLDSASAPSYWRFGALRLDLRPTGSKR